VHFYFINKRVLWLPLDLDFHTTDKLHFSPHHVTFVYFVIWTSCVWFCKYSCTLQYWQSIPIFGQSCLHNDWHKLWSW